MANAVGSTVTSVSRKYTNIGQYNTNFININISNYYSQDSFFLSPPPSPSPSPHRVNLLVAYVFPAMVELLQLMCQTSNDNISPFKVHPKKMNLAIASFLIYCFSYDAQLRSIPSSNHRYHYNSNYVKIVQFVGSIFGPLTLASYSSVLFPSLVPFLYSGSILYSAFLLLYTTRFTKLFKCFYRKFISGRPTLILPV